jgi:hypothetical protein
MNPGAHTPAFKVMMHAARAILEITDTDTPRSDTMKLMRALTIMSSAKQELERNSRYYERSQGS